MRWSTSSRSSQPAGAARPGAVDGREPRYPLAHGSGALRWGGPVDRLGVACLTLCPRCAASDTAPRIGVGTAVRLIAQLRGPLGITVDEMAAALGADR
jgi:hypothetical protein